MVREKNKLFVIMLGVKYDNEVKYEPYMQKLNKKERAILVWKKKVSAEEFIVEHKLTGSEVHCIGDDYLREKAKQYQRNNLVLKMKIVEKIGP